MTRPTLSGVVFGGGTRARGSGDLAVERWVVTTVIVALAAILALLPIEGTLYGLLGVGLALGVLLVAVIGRERTGILLLMVAFAMAPAYKGLAPSVSTPVTPMDLMLFAGIVVIAPSLASRKLNLPPIYLAGMGVIIVTGAIGTLSSDDVFGSILQFVQWMAMIGVLVTFFAFWRPSWKVVDTLGWSFVAGQTASLIAAFLRGPLAGNGRYQGLSHHPNAFAEGAMMAFAILLYLFHRHHGWMVRTLIVLLAGGAVEAVLLSGSRGALVVVGGLVVMVPIVERSAVAGFVWAIFAAIGLNLLPHFVDVGGAGSAITRLAGSEDAAGADQARNHAFSVGWHMFLDHPLLGNGFGGVVNELHDLYLSVAVGGGIVCLFGYLVVLYCFARPLFGNHPRRRLAYVAWGFLAITPTVPALDDRTLWLPMVLVTLLALETQASAAAEDTDEAAPTQPLARPLPARTA